MPRKYIGHAFSPKNSDTRTEQKLASVYAHISNSGVSLNILANDRGEPKVHLSLGAFGHSAETTFFLASEGLREFGLAFLQAASFPFNGWYCNEGRTPCSPGLNWEKKTEDGYLHRFEIPEEELFRRRDLLRTELALVEEQLGLVVDAPPYDSVVEAFKRSGAIGIVSSGGLVVSTMPEPEGEDLS